MSGAIVGSIVWWRRPQNHLNAEEYIQYKAMLISLATHLLLLMFELLVADQLESDRHYWILVFVPLVFVSLISIPICIWSVRHDRSFELELFCAVNMLQFIFIALRLDRYVFTVCCWVFNLDQKFQRDQNASSNYYDDVKQV